VRISPKVLISATILFCFSLFTYVYTYNIPEYLLADGLSVLNYICTDSWKTGRGIYSGIIAQLSSNGIYTFIYPKILHCGGKPTWIGVYMLNNIGLLVLLYSCRKSIVRSRVIAFVLLTSLLYATYSLQVASKELVLSLVILAYVRFTLDFAIVLERHVHSANQKKKLIGYLVGLMLLASAASLMRPSYILLFLAPIIIITVYNIKLAKVSHIFPVIILLLPSLINIFLPHLLGSAVTDGDQGLILEDYLGRYSREEIGSRASLTANFTPLSPFINLLHSAFGYRHIRLSDDGNIPLFIAHIGTKISVAMYITTTLFLTLNNALRPNLYTNGKETTFVCNSRYLLSSCILISVMIYPFPHERYFLPGVPAFYYLMTEQYIICQRWLARVIRTY
jgi:hypothetical protein